MNDIRELKNKIENNTLDDAILIFKYNIKPIKAMTNNTFKTVESISNIFFFILIPRFYN